MARFISFPLIFLLIPAISIVKQCIVWQQSGEENNNNEVSELVNFKKGLQKNSFCKLTKISLKCLQQKFQFLRKF